MNPFSFGTQKYSILVKISNYVKTRNNHDEQWRALNDKIDTMFLDITASDLSLVKHCCRAHFSFRSTECRREGKCHTDSWIVQTSSTSSGPLPLPSVYPHPKLSNSLRRVSRSQKVFNKEAACAQLVSGLLFLHKDTI